MLLAPSDHPARISQILPTVKCSSCNQPVPLADLGEHACSGPPPNLPLPPVPTRPPQVSVPSALSPGSPLRLSQAPPQPRIASTFIDRPRINTNLSSYPQRSSPLAQSEFSPRSRPPATIPTPTPKPSLQTPWSADGRAPSNVKLSTPSSSAPRTPNPYLAAPHGPPQFLPPHPPVTRVASYVPESEIGIDTKIGGEAGMAGVGRRGFAAAARAAMFATPPFTSGRPNPPRFLDIDVASRSTGTPPLSPGSGYSSHSPGPLSPLPQAELVYPEHITKSSPSPPATIKATSPHRDQFPEEESINEENQMSRTPFFDNFKSKMNNTSTFEHNRSPPRSTRDTIGSSSVYSNQSPLTRLRNLSISTVNSQSPTQHIKNNSFSDSGSDCGLAYADSSDNEDDDDDGDDDDDDASPSTKDKPLTSSLSILRSKSNRTVPANNHVHFSSISMRLEQANAAHSRDHSGSSHSPVGESSTKRDSEPLKFSRSSLGSDSDRVGATLKRSTSDSSSDSHNSHSTYSRVNSMMTGPLSKMGMERAMETLLEDEPLDGSSLLKSNSQRSLTISQHIRSESQSRGIGMLTMSSGPKAHRSNTVQVPVSPENKAPKLPARANTSATPVEHNKSDFLGKDGPRRPRKPRICLRCEIKIEDGKWVKVDTGGALCERCWKNMYLPKCRRCNLPIERQAISSADGQLKGKYHKDCFNCFVCHKPFPDKSFYVYDGKPLCAYHYHEANDSLCAAARCGQPIEGPCAVSHAGDKYHPEHMTCEYDAGPPCNERLMEYWEVDGRMLCERHASRAGSDFDHDDDWVQTSKAKKRVTRFIDLAGGNTDTNDGVVG